MMDTTRRSTTLRGIVAALSAAALAATVAGCSQARIVGKSGLGTTSGGPTASPTSTVTKTSGSTPTPTRTNSTATPQWPTPEDCITYNPAAVTVVYEAGIYSVNDGTTVVMRPHGGPGTMVGDQGLALAQRYHRHCFLGRGNTREDANSYIFDYWRDPSGSAPVIPDEEDACSPYNNHNLTVEDMGDGNGWRVKDHDHVLQLFDNESDARNGALVLSKYHQICFIGDNSDQDPEVVSYFK